LSLNYFYLGLSEKVASNGEQVKSKPTLNYVPIKLEPSDPDATIKCEMVNIYI